MITPRHFELFTGLLLLQLREKLVAPSGIQADQQRIVYSGRILKDQSTLSSYGTSWRARFRNLHPFCDPSVSGFKTGHSLHLVKSATNQVGSMLGSQVSPSKFFTPVFGLGGSSGSRGGNSPGTGSNAIFLPRTRAIDPKPKRSIFDPCQLWRWRTGRKSFN